MTFGASIVYSYAFVVPLFVYLALRYAGVRLALVDTICLYGYSLFVYIPASVREVNENALMLMRVCLLLPRRCCVCRRVRSCSGSVWH
jgi:hypothetical protein